MLAQLAEHISTIFTKDLIHPRHESLHISIYEQTDDNVSFYSTTPGFHQSAYYPFLGQHCLGLFAVIKSSLIQLAIRWPAMTMIPMILTSPQEESQYLLDDTRMAFCITENSLIIWSPSPEDLLIQCEKVSDYISLAKSEKYANGSQASFDDHASYCPPVEPTFEYQNQSTDSLLCHLTGLERLEAFGDWMVDPSLRGDYDTLYPKLVIDQEFEIEIEPSDPGIGPSSYLLSPIPMTPGLSISSPRSSSLSIRSLSPIFTVPKSPLMDVAGTWTDNDMSSPSTINLNELSFKHIVQTKEIEMTEDAVDVQNNALSPCQVMINNDPALEPVHMLTTPSTEAVSAGINARAHDRSGQKAKRTTRSCFSASPSLCPHLHSPAGDSASEMLHLPSVSPLSSISSFDDEYHLEEGNTEEEEEEEEEEEKPKTTRRRQKRKKTKGRFSCQFCREKFTREADADRHLASCSENPVREEKKPCGYCGKGLPVRYDARVRHWRSPTCLRATRSRGIVPGSLIL